MIKLSPEDYKKLHPLNQIAINRIIEFQNTALPHQLIPRVSPAGKRWDEYVVSGGRGCGKTFLGVNWAWQRAWCVPNSVGCIISGTHLDLNQTILEAFWKSCPIELVRSFNQQNMTIKFMNGSRLVLRAAQAYERVRGLNLHFCYCDEIAGWEKNSADLAFRLLRLANRLSIPEYDSYPQTLVTSTPKMSSLFQHWKKKVEAGDPRTVIRYASSYDNPHIAAEFARTVGELDATSAFARMEVSGEIISLDETAIFPANKFRLWKANKPYPKFERLILSLDCAFTEKTLVGVDSDSSSTACIVAGVFKHEGDNHVMILSCWNEKLAYPKMVDRVIESYEDSYGKDENLGTGGQRINEILIEDAASGKSLIQSLRALNLPVMGAKVAGVRLDKVERAVTCTPILFEKKIWVPASSSDPTKPARYMQEFMDQVTTFPNSPIPISQTNVTGKTSGKSPTDIVDAFSHAIRHFMNLKLIQSDNIVTRWERKRSDYREPAMNPYAQ